MTPLQQQAINDCIDQREQALDSNRVEEARMWQEIILHTWEAFTRHHGCELPAYGVEDRLVPHSPRATMTRDGRRIN